MCKPEPKKYTAENITNKQIHQLFADDEINHATWANALFHSNTLLGKHARARCAEILNSREGK